MKPEDFRRQQEPYLEYCYKKLDTKHQNKNIDSDIANYFISYHKIDNNVFENKINKITTKDLFNDINIINKKVEKFNVEENYKRFTSANASGDHELNFKLLKRNE